MATVEVSGLSKAYGDVQAVVDLDLTIGDGEFFVVLGPSGAGKTTTLKSVAGLVDVDSRPDVVGALASKYGWDAADPATDGARVLVRVTVDRWLLEPR